VVKNSRTLRESFDSLLKGSEAAAFSGWDFSYIYGTGRMAEAPVAWNYYNVVRPHISRAEYLLDMGTGGGEMLSGFKPLPPHTYATEQYHPNVAVARKRLKPLGVEVVEIEEEKQPPYNSKLPFKNGFFDLIINRHEAYYPPELMRILKPGGCFITQQVGSLNNLTLTQFFLGRTVLVSNWNLKSAVDELEAAGLRMVRRQEDITFYRFYDIGAVAYFLKAVPWTLGDFTGEAFSAGKYRDRLWELHVKISEDGCYDTHRHRFLVVAEKQA